MLWFDQQEQKSVLITLYKENLQLSGTQHCQIYVFTKLVQFKEKNIFLIHLPSNWCFLFLGAFLFY